MKIQIARPCALHEIGKRTNNEDNLFPAKGMATSDDRLFLVCDGVGGAEKGEIASDIACQAIPDYFRRNSIFKSEAQTVYDAIAFAKTEIEKFLRDNPGSEGMATTLTLLHLHEDGATIAHIGDSRVYHIRNGKILWKTRDHSYVNDLVNAGLITEAEALSHPRRNVIMRALQGNDPNVTADVHTIPKINKGDYFFLCSDGILESVDDTTLTEILSTQDADTVKMERIAGLCRENSRDNFSAYLVRITQVENLTVELLQPVEFNKKVPVRESKGAANGRILRESLGWVLALAAFSAVWYLFHQPAKVTKTRKQQTTYKHVSKDSSASNSPSGQPFKIKVKNKLNNNPR
ncbi:hypothetical protein DYBT9275_01455 [Dyadobacter sp. CECT 9275]|uniref:PPM-type phosphatase domain-containing protein n=1 Tax=Dyadobacter helix TaxID=2822344 RepID=A0A916NB49_9BACT|nr:protein phosphatase 2C domain-containing protein [Dyadobacter sp. CECT 9275]CAG4994734.1 hypothetical protein DYBT9275_01455 [Dyadobacter sp. CECT 9275]